MADGSPRPVIVVVTGVSGVGKSTVAQGLSTLLGWPLAEGDTFHPEANVARMAAGIPLTDEDRWPWLRTLGAWMSDEIAAGRSAVVTCSALRRVYRDLLRDGRPEVTFCHLVGAESTVRERMRTRSGHFMPESLLASQLDTLEPLAPDEPGAAVPVDGDLAEVIARAVAALALPLPEGGAPPSPSGR
ncbi:MAG: gluconokinase [Nocardioidaceae bacterium]